MKSIVQVWLLPFVAVIGVLVILQHAFRVGPLVSLDGAYATWATLLVGIVVQATPFLVLGVLVSGAIAAFVPKDLLSRITPRSALLAVPTAGVAGMVLPGCECASVPVAQSLMRRGLSQAAALAFLLAAPAVNPVVLVATAVAVNNNPRMVWARLLASLLAVLVVGWLWALLGKPEWMRPQTGHDHQGVSRATVFRTTAMHDLVQAGGFLVMGAAAAAAIKVVVPVGVLSRIGANLWLAVLVMAALAVLLALCSEADAFVVASFSAISPTAQLVFLVVGPMVDIKLFAMQSGAFGTRFAARFMSLTLVCCIAAGVLVGTLLLAG